MTMQVCVVEDDRHYRESLTMLLEIAPDAALVSAFRSPKAFLEEVAELEVDVVIMDLDLPDMDGTEAIRRLRAAGHEVPVVVLTAFDDPPRIVQAIQAGADGYLLKRATGDELLSHLRQAVSGGAALTPGVARSVLDLLRDRRPKSRNPPPKLSRRERHVLEALVRGLSYKQVAAELGVTTETVRSYVRTLYKKLRVHSATEAVSKALREGWVD